MRKLILIGFIPIMGLFSCGGGPSSQETGIESASTSYVQQDIVCCSDYDDENNTCRSYSIPQPESFTVTVTNENLTGNNTQPIQVRGCTARFYPKNEAPEVPEGNEYVSCTPITIEPGETGNVVVNLQSPLVELMHDYYLDLERTLSYRVKITFDIKGYYSGDYDTSIFVDVDFSDFIFNENDKCSTGG